MVDTATVLQHGDENLMIQGLEDQPTSQIFQIETEPSPPGSSMVDRNAAVPSTSRVEAGSFVKDTVSDIFSFECLFCGTLIVKLSALRNHISTKHSQFKVPIRCLKCKSCFSGLTPLKNHNCINKNSTYNAEQLEVTSESDLLDNEIFNPNGYTRIVTNLVYELEAHDKLPHICIDKIVNAFQLILHEDLSQLITNHKRKQEFMSNGIYLKPKEIIVANSKAYIFSIPKILTMLLKHKEIYKFCSDPLELSPVNGIMTDLIHGTAVRTHKGFKSHKHNNIGLLLYLDDIEVCNPLGKNRGTHKLCLIYISIINIPSKIRSQLKFILPIAVLKSSAFKLHEHKKQIMSHIINDMKEMENGIVVNNKTFYAYIFGLHGDALALNQILSLKESFSIFCKKTCIKCTETREKYPSLYNHNLCQLRSLGEFREQCEAIEEAYQIDQIGYRELSKNLGINRKTPLLELPFFDCIKDSLYDPLHVLFEGLLPKELQLCLSSMASNKIITWRELNDTISNFKFHKSIKSSEYPKPFDNHFGFKYTGKSVLILVTHLPIFLNNVSNCENWKCMSLLIQITKLIWSLTLTFDAFKHVEKLVKKHHELYVRLYGEENVIPKLHMLVHTVEQLYTHGPGRFFSCIRPEAKHFQVKKKRFYNFKNLPKSVADSLILNTFYGYYESDGSEKVLDLPATYQIVTVNPDCVQSSLCFIITKVDLHGVRFRENDIILVNLENNIPQFGIIKDFKLCDDIIKVSYKVTTSIYITKYMGYKITPTNLVETKTLFDIVDYKPQINYELNRDRIVILLSSHFY